MSEDIVIRLLQGLVIWTSRIRMDTFPLKY